MSENISIMPDLETPPIHSTTQRAKPKMPGMILAICIIYLILGLGGLVSSCFGMILNLILSFVINAIPASSDPNALQVSDFLQARVLPGIIIAALNFLVAPMLIVGSIGALCSKRWGLTFLRWALIAAVVFVVIKAGLTVQMQLNHLEFSNSMADQISTSEGPSSPAELKRFLQPFHYRHMFLTLFGLFVFFNAYIGGFFYLNSKQAKRYRKALE